MTYPLHFKDLLMHALIGSKAEITPCYAVILREKVDGDRLEKALNATLSAFPLMKTEIAYEGGVCFKTNDRPLPILSCPISERPKTLGKGANGYLWRLTYHDRTVYLDTAHNISDGRGWLLFFTALINAYFGVSPAKMAVQNDKSLEEMLIPNAESFVKRKPERGYSRKTVAFCKETRCHFLTADIKQVLAAVHKIDASPATVFAPLFSRTLRKYIAPGAKNKTVRCLMPVDARGILGFDTIHNAIIEAILPYTDRCENIEIGKLSTIYRGMLDLRVQPESVSAYFAKQMRAYKPILCRKSKLLLKTAGKIGAFFQKKTMCNFEMSYIGKVRFAPEAAESVELFYSHSWHQFQDCCIALNEYNGTLNITVIESYKRGDEIVDDFIEECRLAGIELRKTENRFEGKNIDMVKTVL